MAKTAGGGGVGGVDSDGGDSGGGGGGDGGAIFHRRPSKRGTDKAPRESKALFEAAESWRARVQTTSPRPRAYD